MASFVLRGIARLLKWAMYAAWALAGLILLAWAAFGLYIEYEDEWILKQDAHDASAINARGDRVIAETEQSGLSPRAAKTVIRLKRAHHWFSTTLLEAESKDYLVGLNWQGQDKLVLQLDFGCNARITPPIETVGPITIVYRFGDAGGFPPHGYDSFPRDVPRQSC